MKLHFEDLLSTIMFSCHMYSVVLLEVIPFIVRQVYHEVQLF